MALLCSALATRRLLALCAQAYRPDTRQAAHHRLARLVITALYGLAVLPFIALAATHWLPSELFDAYREMLSPLVPHVAPLGSLVAAAIGGMSSLFTGLVAGAGLFVLSRWSPSASHGDEAAATPAAPRPQKTPAMRLLDQLQAWQAAGRIDGRMVGVLRPWDALPPLVMVEIELTGVEPELELRARQSAPDVPGIGDLILDRSISASGLPRPALLQRLGDLHQPPLTVFGEHPDAVLKGGVLQVRIDLGRTKVRDELLEEVTRDGLQLAQALESSRVQHTDVSAFTAGRQPTSATYPLT